MGHVAYSSKNRLFEPVSGHFPPIRPTIDKAFRIATPMRKASWTKRFAEGWGERRGANADGGSGGEGWREWAGGVSEKSLPIAQR